jgi:GNAT superfamily N-acetyltransferase
MRLFRAPDKGYGYVGDDIPELGIAVLREHRGRGIGSALLQQLLEIAALSHEAVSLSVSRDNPARRLSERIGGQANCLTTSENRSVESSTLDRSK